MKIISSLFGCILLGHLLQPNNVFAQISKRTILRDQIQKIIAISGAKVSVSIMGLDFKESFTINNSEHYPMQSTYKFPLAIAVLHQVDKGKLSLEQKIHIPKTALDTATWSPIVKDFPGQDIDLTLVDLLAYTVSQSDNNGCDALFRLIGGCKVVDQYVHHLGVKGISITATEAEMKKAWKVQYTNWCQPTAMLELLRLFQSGKILTESSTALLMNMMTNTGNSPNRIKDLLFEGAIVAHKTGTSNTNKQGVTAATNDIGIITLPGGKHLGIVVFVSDYKGGIKKGERVIAEIAKLAWDYYSAN